MRRASRKDPNHNQIASCFRQIGFSVFDLSAVGCNCPDMVIALRGKMAFVEVKTEKGKLKSGQEAFIKTWRGKTFVVRNGADVLNIYNTWD